MDRVDVYPSEVGGSDEQQLLGGLPGPAAMDHAATVVQLEYGRC